MSTDAVLTSAPAAASTRATERSVMFETPWHDYAVFGGVLRSDIALPELVPSFGARPDWTFRVEATPAPASAAESIGERQLGHESYWLCRTPSGLRLEYSHAGTFDISGDGATIVWYHRADADMELVRTILLGSALALALEASGFLCLHASAVTIGARALAFIGPKFHGKSTLAAALTSAGARLIGDDLLAVSPGPPATVRPGVASVRLWSDTARALAVDSFCTTVIPGLKTTAAGFAELALHRGVAPLEAVYVLTPVHADAMSEVAHRERLSGVAAAVALASHTKLPDSLIGLRAAGSQLTACATIARTVPIYTLRVVRSLARLPDLVEQIINWHQEGDA